MMDDLTLHKRNQTVETVMNSSFFIPTSSNIPVSVLYSLISLCIIVLVLSLPLNVHVLQLFVRGAGNRVASEFFFLNLCVCEIIVCIVALLNIINFVLFKTEVKSPFYYLTTFLTCMHSISRPFFQCFVCVERYVAMIYPVVFLKYKPLKYRIALSLVAWIIVLGSSVVCSFLSLRDILHYFLPEYVLVFFIKILCSIAVLKALKKPRPGEKLRVKDAESNRMKKKAFWMIMIILIYMCITYFPIMTLIFVYDYSSNIQQSVCILVFSYFLMLSGFVHPFLYLHRVGKLPFITYDSV